MRELIEQVFEQGKKIESLASRANSAQAKLRESSDRVFFSLQDSFTFQQGQNTVQNLVFNVPASDDFEAVRLSFYPFVRRITLTTGGFATSDLTFRPTVWTVQNVTSALRWYAVDALVELTTALSDGKTRRYQNAAFLIAQTFSAYTSPIGNSIATSLQTYDRSESPSALVFDPVWHLPKGSTITARVTPLFSGERDTVGYADDLVNQYQIRGVLEGYKRAR